MRSTRSGQPWRRATPMQICGERGVHVRVLDGAERLEVVVVAVARQDVGVGDRDVIELDLGVLDLGHERRGG